MRNHILMLSVILCLSMLFAFPVSAAATDVDVYVTPKGTVIDVSIETDGAIGALQGAISYDSDKIEYDAAALDDGISAYNAVGNSFKNSNGITRVALVGDSSSGTENEWARVTYSAEENTPAAFELNGFKAFNVDGTAADAVFTVVVLGDANGDNLVNLKDYVKYKKVLAIGENYSVNAKNLDLDKSGTENEYDMFVLRRSVVFG